MSGTQLLPVSCCPAWLIQVSEERMEGATQHPPPLKGPDVGMPSSHVLERASASTFRCPGRCWTV